MRLNLSTYRLPDKKRSSRRGSTLLIVLAVLSLLVLMAVTLGYTSKLEVISSRNFEAGVQRDIAVISSLRSASLEINKSMPYQAIGEFDLHKGLVQGNFREGVITENSHVFVEDLSAKLNVNTASPEALQRFFGKLAYDNQMELNVSGLVSGIVARRTGNDGMAGAAGVDDNDTLESALFINDDTKLAPKSTRISLERNQVKQNLDPRGIDECNEGDGQREELEKLIFGEDEDEEFVADIRYPAFGDDLRFGRLEELLEVPGMTPRLFTLAAPYLTVFSVSQQLHFPSSEEGEFPVSPVDLNRATAEELYEALYAEYGYTKDEELLKQFAANVVDYRDLDSVPTILHLNGADVIGFERTPVIIEVYPDAITSEEDGDDGQFVEVYNPWPEPFNLSGWRLTVNGVTIPLTGQLGSQDYLIVTDDYKDEADDDGYSFFDNFGRATNNASKRIIENQSLNLPESGSMNRVELLDGDGNLIDQFVYNGNAGFSTATSLQRANSIVREVQVAPVTPFGRYPESAPDSEVVQKLLSSPKEAPFLTPYDILNVFSGFARMDGDEGNRWGFPVEGSPKSGDSSLRSKATDPAHLDLRLLDLFAVEANKRPRYKGLDREDADTERKSARDRLNPWHRDVGDASAEDLSRLERDAEAHAFFEYAVKPVGHRNGRVNLNTAEAPVLHALGLSEEQIQYILAERDVIFNEAISGVGSRTVLYKSYEELFSDDNLWSLYSGDDCQLKSLRETLLKEAGFSSSAFLLEGAPLEVTKSDGKDRHSPRAQMVVAFDGSTPELVYWRLAP